MSLFSFEQSLVGLYIDTDHLKSRHFGHPITRIIVSSAEFVEDPLVRDGSEFLAIC